jgi:NTE family protein
VKRALVLGGGGNVGIAWEIAILAALRDGGVDGAAADVVIGTSAGSVVGTHIRHDRDPRDLHMDQLSDEPRPLTQDGFTPDMPVMTETFTMWSSFDEMTPEACAAVGAGALKARTMPEDAWVAAFARNEWPGWPDAPLFVTAVDCESGAFVPLHRDSGATIERAAAASCSVPAMFPPVTINGRRYTDGGVRSGTSADLALAFAPDVALIIAPMGASDRGVGLLAARQIDREKRELEDAGASVRVVMFDDAVSRTAGPNLMDPTRRAAVAAAGYEQGARLAADIHAWWSGA